MVFLFQPQLPLGSTKEENAMTQQVTAMQTCAGAIDTVAQADRAIRQLLAFGLSKDQLAAICPVKFKDPFRPEVAQAEAATADPGVAIAIGATLATLGGSGFGSGCHLRRRGRPA
jgi:hypothetical protein